MLCFNPSNYQTMVHGLCFDGFRKKCLSEQAGLHRYMIKRRNGNASR